MLRGFLFAAAITASGFANVAIAAGAPSLLASSPKINLASGEVTLDGEALPYATWHKLLLPGERLDLALSPGQSATVDGKPIGAGWTAGEPGNHRLVVTDVSGAEVANLTLFVMTPSSEIDSRGYIGKFRMGTYPNGTTPRGFIRLEEGDMNLPVSPHFKVGQFICKQQPGLWPKYLLVSGDNLERLETLLASLRADDLTDADTLFVMSGWRSPFYNTSIGSAKLSRHMYGDAADVYIDHAPRDGNMDDINDDGRITKADANFLYDYSAELFAEEDVEKGGLGAYKANAVHGPFVHVDARGRPARWGR